MTSPLAGACLCGAVEYAIHGRVKSVVNCHCGLCKRITGAAFESIVVVSERSLKFVSGKDRLVAYALTENADKHFCRVCGTPIFNTNKKVPGNCMIHVGSLNDPTLVAPTMNLHCESMLPWVRDIAGLQNYEKEPSR